MFRNCCCKLICCCFALALLAHRPLFLQAVSGRYCLLSSRPAALAAAPVLLLEVRVGNLQRFDIDMSSNEPPRVILEDNLEGYATYKVAWRSWLWQHTNLPKRTVVEKAGQTPHRSLPRQMCSPRVGWAMCCHIISYGRCLQYVGS